MTLSFAPYELGCEVVAKMLTALFGCEVRSDFNLLE
jgi:hypothetical protein